MSIFRLISSSSTYGTHNLFDRTTAKDVCAVYKYCICSCIQACITLLTSACSLPLPIKCTTMILSLTSFIRLYLTPFLILSFFNKNLLSFHLSLFQPPNHVLMLHMRRASTRSAERRTYRGISIYYNYTRYKMKL